MPGGGTYAHSAPEGGAPQDLLEHLRGVAERAGGFAGAFGSEAWGRWVGLLHDVGKYLPGFQAYLRGEGASVEHSGAGAALACRADRQHGMAAAFAVAGHHGGLANLTGSGEGLPTPLRERLGRSEAVVDEVVGLAPAEVGGTSAPAVPALYGTVAGEEFGLVVTPGGYTAQAKSFARGKSNLRLVAGGDLVEMVLQHYEELDPRYKGLIPLKRVYVPQALEESEG